jgi:uncharacterized protein
VLAPCLPTRAPESRTYSVSPTFPFSVKAKPDSKESLLSQEADGSWTAKVKAQPIGGKANEALIKLIADHFELRKSQVRLVSGGIS